MKIAKKVGRPRLAREKKRRPYGSVFLNDEERALADQFRGHQTIGRWLREVLLEALRAKETPGA